MSINQQFILKALKKSFFSSKDFFALVTNTPLKHINI